MKILSPKETKITLQRFKELDPAIMDKCITDVVNNAINRVKSNDKNIYKYNPYLKSYLVILMYKNYILFGVEKSGLETAAAAKKDAVKTLQQIRKDKIPDYSLKRIALEINRLDAGMAKLLLREQRRDLQK